MNKLILKGMEFYAFHGYYSEETKIGGNYSVDLELYTNLSQAAASDNLEDTVNYAAIYDLIKGEMQVPSKLIEHVAGRILKKILLEYKEINGVRIIVNKLNPPLGGKLHSASVELEKWKTNER
jgi:7,8-dihydroneopterin aldolase/epimerase/oxygenase